MGDRLPITTDQRLDGIDARAWALEQRVDRLEQRLSSEAGPAEADDRGERLRAALRKLAVHLAGWAKVYRSRDTHLLDAATLEYFAQIARNALADPPGPEI